MCGNLRWDLLSVMARPLRIHVEGAMQYVTVGGNGAPRAELSVSIGGEIPLRSAPLVGEERADEEAEEHANGDEQKGRHLNAVDQDEIHRGRLFVHEREDEGEDDEGGPGVQAVTGCATLGQWASPSRCERIPRRGARREESTRSARV